MSLDFFDDPDQTAFFDSDKELTVLPALWALRLAANNPRYLKRIINHHNVCASWLMLVGDYLDFPAELMDSFMQASLAAVLEHAGQDENSNRLDSSIDWVTVAPLFREACRKQPATINQLISSAVKKQEAYYLSRKPMDRVWNNCTMLCDILGLNQIEHGILLFLAYMKICHPLRVFLEEIEFKSITKAIEPWATMLGVSQEAINSSLHLKQPLMSYGLISSDEFYMSSIDFINFNQKIKSLLLNASQTKEDLLVNFTEVASNGNLTVEDIPHHQDNLALLTKVLKNALLNKERGVNILLYGQPGTGKTEFAKLLAKEMAAALYEVPSKGKDENVANGKERLLSLMMSQKYLGNSQGSLLLFDESDDVLEGSPFADYGYNKRGNSSRSRFGKAWINEQLETNPVPVIWICNHAESIDPAHLRLFVYHLEFKVPPRSVRQKMAEHFLKDFRLPPTTLASISQHTEVSPGQLQNSARLLKLYGQTESNQAEKILTSALHNSMAVLVQTTRKPAVLTNNPYRLDYLNIDCQFPLPKLVESLRKRRQGKLCLYGPPGTGKTQLAHYLGDQLDCPVIVKRASDLLSKWIGESEANIAAMFREAQAENAILLLDEADSYLRDRQGMERSWEVSQVNELLQQMEAFTGIFICATNLFEQLDQAALRRFEFKLRFDYLKPQQRQQLFTECVNLPSPAAINEMTMHQLNSLDTLTPGDFSTVLRQARIMDELPSPDDFIHQLQTECAIKNGGRNQRSIGFAATLN